MGRQLLPTVVISTLLTKRLRLLFLRLVMQVFRYRRTVVQAGWRPDGALQA